MEAVTQSFIANVTKQRLYNAFIREEGVAAKAAHLSQRFSMSDKKKLRQRGGAPLGTYTATSSRDVL
jgi:hypothetical protein